MVLQACSHRSSNLQQARYVIRGYLLTSNKSRSCRSFPNTTGRAGSRAAPSPAATGAPAITISNNAVRNYDKNGITASGPGTGGGPAVTVTGNTVIGLGPTAVTAQNGIQIGFGATGSVTSNYVVDDVYTGPTYGSSGILIYASAGVTASSSA